MLVYAGIDEAGYGPLLGPLCVACSTWTIEDSCDPREPPNLWKSLARAVCRSTKDKRGRIAINDSKKLKGTGTNGAHPMRALERGVLAALSLPIGMPLLTTDLALFDRVECIDPAASAPWYEGSTALPWACESAQIQIACAMLRRAAMDAGVTGHGVICKAVDADAINDAAERGMIKTSVPWSLLVDHLTRLRERWPTTPLRVAADRQSGRMRYVDDLLRAFPNDRLTIIREDLRDSVYHLDRANAPMVISFTVEGENDHFPIALASMTAKYVRELWMARLNRWFAARVADLVPTAGYVQDGRRFVGLVRGALATTGLHERRLIRSV
ncbi:MAG: hypothetical protein EXS15_01050 [Phycisphaerales bacterium]|nr:hypothetical protein [Phycisphaerales bacterium]